MAGKAWAVAIAALVAGCITPPADTLEAAAVLPTPADAQSWTVPVTGAPDGALTSFWWTVPEGAVVPSAWNERMGWDMDVVPLEATFVLPADARPLRWAVFAFAKGDDGLHAESIVANAPVKGHYTGLGASETLDEEVDTDPFFLHAGFDDVKVGDRIGFVVALATETPVEASFVFRTLPEDYDWEDEPADDAESFLAGLEAPPAALAPAASGSGLHLGFYVRWNEAFFPHNLEITGGDVEVARSDTLPPTPVTQAGRLVVSSAMDTPDGWGMIFALAFHTMNHGTYVAKADVRGETVEAKGRIPPDRWYVTPMLFGVPLVFAMGDGEGPQAGALELEATGLRSSLVFYQSIGLGTTVETLLGAKAEADSETWKGLLPMPVHTDGDRLAAIVEGVEIVVPVR